MERQRILELDGLLTKLLLLKDSDFTKFINNYEAVKPFLVRLQMFCSMSAIIEIDEVSFGLHEKILKFLLRLCPSFNRLLPTKKDQDLEISSQLSLRAVICPKKFLELLFDPDPLGLLAYLFTTWNPSEYLDIIRDDLVPDSLIKILSKGEREGKSKAFLKWISRNSIKQGGPMKSTERESILRRFEYESDDDYFEDSDDNENDNDDNFNREMDPLQVILLSNYIKSPSTFSRTSTARKSADRLSLLKAANLSHEQLEGWALMLERNPKKSNILQDFIIYQKNNPPQ